MRIKHPGESVITEISVCIKISILELFVFQSEALLITSFVLFL